MASSKKKTMLEWMREEKKHKQEEELKYLNKMEKFKSYIRQKKRNNAMSKIQYFNKLVRAVGPKWYQELSNAQRECLDHLRLAILLDLSKGNPNGTQTLLAKLGILPCFKNKLVMKALVECKNKPMLFLWELYKNVFGRDPTNVLASYSLEARLLLSSIASLGLKETVQQFKKQLDNYPKAPLLEIKKVNHNEKKSKRRKHCKNAYLAEPMTVPYYNKKLFTVAPLTRKVSPLPELPQHRNLRSTKPKSNKAESLLKVNNPPGQDDMLQESLKSVSMDLNPESGISLSTLPESFINDSPCRVDSIQQEEEDKKEIYDDSNLNITQEVKENKCECVKWYPEIIKYYHETWKSTASNNDIIAEFKEYMSSLRNEVNEDASVKVSESFNSNKKGQTPSEPSEMHFESVDDCKRDAMNTPVTNQDDLKREKVDVGAVKEKIDVGNIKEKIDVGNIKEKIDVGNIKEKIDVGNIKDQIDVGAVKENGDKTDIKKEEGKIKSLEKYKNNNPLVIDLPFKYNPPYTVDKTTKHHKNQAKQRNRIKPSTLLQILLAEQAASDNMIALLPELYRLPVLREWARKRIYGEIKPEKKDFIMHRCNMYWGFLYHSHNIKTQTKCLRETQSLGKYKEMENRVLTEQKRKLIEVTRIFWPTVELEKFPNQKMRFEIVVSWLCYVNVIIRTSVKIPEWTVCNFITGIVSGMFSLRTCQLKKKIYILDNTTQIKLVIGLFFFLFNIVKFATNNLICIPT